MNLHKLGPISILTAGVLGGCNLQSDAEELRRIYSNRIGTITQQLDHIKATNGKNNFLGLVDNPEVCGNIFFRKEYDESGKLIGVTVKVLTHETPIYPTRDGEKKDQIISREEILTGPEAIIFSNRIKEYGDQGYILTGREKISCVDFSAKKLVTGGGRDSNLWGAFIKDNNLGK